MEIVVRNEWESSDTLEIFYTKETRHIYHRNQYSIKVTPLEDPSSTFQIDSPVFGKLPLLNLSSILDSSYMLLQFSDKELSFFKASNKSVSRFKQDSKVLGYHWLSSDSFSDSVCITKDYIRYINGKPGKFSTKKTIKLRIDDYRYEHTTGVLAIVSRDHPEEIQICYTKKYSGSTSYVGGRITIDCPDVISSSWDAIERTKNCLENKGGQLQDSSFYLEIIYSELYFLSLDCMQGTLEIVKIDNNSRTLIYFFPGLYELRILQDLIVLHSHSGQLSYLYDIESEVYKLQPFAIIWHSSRHSVRERKQIEYSLPVNYIDSSVFLDQSLLYIDVDLSLDTSGKLYQSVIIPETVVEEHSNKIESLFFLMRRQGYTAVALRYLRGFIESRLELENLYEIFVKLTSKPVQEQLCSEVFVPLVKHHFKYLYEILHIYVHALYSLRIKPVVIVSLLLAKLCIKMKQISHLDQLIRSKVIRDSMPLVSLLQRTLGKVDDDVQTELFRILVDMLFRMKEYTDMSNLLMDTHYEIENISFITRHSLVVTPERVFRYLNTI